MTTPQHLSDRYELGDILGFGGMSEVHLARDVRLHRDVAVKVLRADLARDPSFYLRFRREAQNAAALNHSSIVAVYDTGEAETPEGPLPYIVMEYVEGVTLRDIVRNDGPMEQRQAVEVIADACEALNFSHQNGIIHRDVKPANIMISKTGAVKVMDFGIARALADTGNRLTRTSAVIGTAQYLSPEQASGENVDARSDVYSLGCVLYEMLTGKPPFTGDSPVSVAYQHVRKDPVRPSKRSDAVSPELDAVVLKALAKNPENRYQSAAEMRADLIRVHSGETPDAPKLFSDAEQSHLLSTAPSRGGALRPTEQIPARGKSVRRWVIAVAMLAVLAVVVTVGFTVFGARDARVPDVYGQKLDAARTALENAGFTVNVQTKPDSTVDQGEAINTEPDADSMARTGDVITINVSTGISQEKVPDCTTLTFQECKSKLEDAGFEKVVQASKASKPEDQGQVVEISPPVDSTASITNEITVFVGSGPGTAPVPPVPAGATWDVAQQILGASKFTNLIQVPVDSVLPAGQVVGTLPPAGQVTPLNDLIQVQVSKGNQIPMPDLTGKFWADVVTTLQGQGFTGTPSNAGDVPGSADQRAKVVRQDPPPGAGVTRDGTITLYFGS
ncbi:Stk1 family PASTA domain-containing Ser/Thr kinase [Mycolicibacterium sp. P9-64]|uniref:Stk1 family PASTA domain-containing Ser/Thr kinase n=1 Tax=Mycolicibacterium sp. P9-64 TaxID=2024612 RepID=UPI0011EC5FDD|nr:Stk1 family PASTA domain-containing Ser/Thr kinase [Mycolicibacterium sp. P9-64]KAA0084752.1 Stk1 family PASTA domain-containing Ser/Thr kinase [Mycolicibacterium sp. P9-64]